jgi:hypothetical protein
MEEPGSALNLCPWLTGLCFDPVRADNRQALLASDGFWTAHRSTCHRLSAGWPWALSLTLKEMHLQVESWIGEFTSTQSHKVVQMYVV